MTASTRPVRKDVARNRALLIKAADEVFSARGIDVTLDDIAHHAGVGVATAYRHFANKQALLEALIEDRLGAVLQILQEAEALPDPRAALEHFVYRVGEMQARDRGLRESVGANFGVDKAARIREHLEPPATRLVERAVAAGVLRPEVTVTDFPVVLWMIGAVADYAGPASPYLWRRYLDFVLDGLLADGQGRHPVTEPPLDAQQLDCVMREFHQPNRAAPRG